MKNFSFNKIIILQSINPNDKNLCIVGPQLKGEIDQALSNLCSDSNKYEGVTCDIYNVGSYEEWETFWTTLESQAIKGCKPIIHFICHGSTLDTMAIWNDGSYENIPWAEVYEHLESINIQTHNNIFVSMCVCHGFLSLIHLLDEGKRIPFCGILATPHPEANFEAKFHFRDFYISLVTNTNCADAYELVKKDIQIFKTLESKTNKKAAELFLYFSDELFVKAYKKEILKRRDKNYLNKQASASLQQEEQKGLLNHKFNKENINLFKQININEMRVQYNKLKNFKFMFDLYPEEKCRFDFPNTIQMFKV